MPLKLYLSLIREETMNTILRTILCFFVCCGLIFSAWTPSFAQTDPTGIGFMSDDDDWDDTGTVEVHDPWQNWNQKVFKFNHKVYTYVFKPFSKGYDFLIPKKVQAGINNVFTNVRMPVRFFNNVFQGKFKRAGKEVGRFVINSSAGIGGLFNPAEAAFGLETYNEDFGQTLAHHGWSDGPYIVWPLIGPSNRRDTVGTLIDTAFSPLFWFGVLDVVVEEDPLFAINTVQRINNYSYNIRDDYDSLVDSAIDPYIALQHAYVNNRNKNIKE